MITAAEYSDWTFLSGLYLRNISQADRYRTFEQQLSKSGLTVKIVHDFLEDNPGGIDLTTWRRSAVYEMGDDAAWRIERTARALEDVGAPRTAAAVRTVVDTSLGAMLLRHTEGGGSLTDFLRAARTMDLPSMAERLRGDFARALPEIAAQVGIPAPDRPPVPPDPATESREQIEHCLDQYVTARQNDLESDLARHGDPRQAPGFTRDARTRELDRMRDLLYDRESQREEAARLEGVLGSLRGSVEKDAKAPPGKFHAKVRAVSEGLRTYSARDRGELLPEVTRWLDRASRFVDAHPEIFRPAVTADPALQARLDALGPHEVDAGRSTYVLYWENPAGFPCDWTTISLRVGVPARDDALLARVLDTVARLAADWPAHREALRSEILACFANYAPQLHDFETEDYERDDDGAITETAIFAHCGGGRIDVDATDEGQPSDLVGIPVSFPIAWDEEHGLELHLTEMIE